MTKLSITQAAKDWGISRTTLQRAVKLGKLTSVQVSATRKEVDTAELLRVFGEPKMPQNATSGQVDVIKSVQVEKTQLELKNVALDVENKYLKREIELLRDQIDKLNAMVPLLLSHEKRPWWQRVTGKK